MSDLEKDELIGALNHLYFFTDLVNLPKTKQWINLELNGYMKFNKYFPYYRKFNAKLFNDDKDVNLRCIEIVKDPLGEILTRINDKKDFVITLAYEDIQAYELCNNIEVTHDAIDSNQLRQLTFGILSILQKLLNSIDSKLPNSMRYIKEIEFWQESYRSDEDYKLWFYKQKLKAKKIWKSIYKYLKEFNLEFFPPEIYNKESMFNNKFYNILKKEFPNIELNGIISGRIHVDLSEANIAIEVKKLESNTPKDELIGQIKEDLRIGSFVYGIIFGIDYTSSKELTKYNELMFEEGKIYCIIKPYPY